MTTNLNEQIRELIDSGARPVSSTEIIAHRTPPVPRFGQVAARPGQRRRKAAAVAAGIAAVGSAAAITVAVLGGGANPGSGRVGTVLTAAMVRQVAVASRIAISHAGHVRIRYSVVSSLDRGRGAGTDDITFSGKNWNYVSDQTAPPNGRSINRFVGGRLYYFGQGFARHRGAGLRWYRETNPRELSHVMSVTAPDPRRLLRVLDPAARFVRAGHTVIAGVWVEHLHATRLAHLPGLGALPGDARPLGRVTALDVWVDRHGVIRRIHLTSQMRIRTSDRQKFYVVKKNGTVKLKTLARHGPVRHGIERASAWVSFLDIGRSQTIIAPAHAIPVHGRG
jgi:hypothetical protein